MGQVHFSLGETLGDKEICYLYSREIQFSGRSVNLIRETWSLSGHDQVCRRVD